MIKKIVIDKFKSINHLEITPAGNFNVLIGENNIGKTTIFEAIHLWKMCYDNNLKKDKSGFYSTAHHLKFESMEFIRAYHDEDLFPIGCSGKDAKCAVTLVIEYNGQSYNLGFTVSKVSNIDDAYLQVDYIDGNAFKSFATMVAGIQGKNLATFFGINESRPIPNIVAKEPYMYKAQVLDKIAKGKGYEVLRNKVISHISEVETHIKNVTGEDFVFSESEKDDKTYISIKVNGKDIFSYGSGFLQLTEIFSSMEYLDPEIYILLIDEPDAHLHLKLQKRLIEEFRNIPNAQMFIITHNERFMEQVDEDEILFLDESSKSAGTLNHLQIGTKWVALEDLKGCLNQLDKLRLASKLIMVEGQTDIDFFNNIKSKYEAVTGKSEPIANVYIPMRGIDTLNGKLVAYSRALKGVIPDSCKWLIIRDTDCVPCTRKESAGNDDKKDMDTSADVKVLFQDVYGIESTFAAEPRKLARILGRYYLLDDSVHTTIETYISETSSDFSRRVRDITDTELYGEFENHFNRQIKNRSGRTYRSLQFRDVLAVISSNNIQYIMTKGIMNKYLKAIHDKIVIGFPQTASMTPLDIDSIFTEYYSHINTVDDLLDCHKTILDEIYT